MKELELLNKLESYIKDYGCSNGTLELLEELKDSILKLSKQLRILKAEIQYLGDRG